MGTAGGQAPRVMPPQPQTTSKLHGPRAASPGTHAMSNDLPHTRAASAPHVSSPLSQQPRQTTPPQSSTQASSQQFHASMSHHVRQSAASPISYHGNHGHGVYPTSAMRGTPPVPSVGMPGKVIPVNRGSISGSNGYQRAVQSVGGAPASPTGLAQSARTSSSSHSMEPSGTTRSHIPLNAQGGPSQASVRMARASASSSHTQGAHQITVSGVNRGSIGPSVAHRSGA